MGISEDPSERLVEQRLRNRAMEAVETMSMGDDGVRAVGSVEYFEEFFDVIDDDAPWHWREWSCFTPAEVDALADVLRTVNAAAAATPRDVSDESLIASDWPAKIALPAQRALELMRVRGRFSEEVEEEEPSDPA